MIFLLRRNRNFSFLEVVVVGGIFECGSVWSMGEIDDWTKPYSLIKYLRMGDDINIVYDEAAEKKLIMKNIYAWVVILTSFMTK